MAIISGLIANLAKSFTFVKTSNTPFRCYPAPQYIVLSPIMAYCIIACQLGKIMYAYPEEILQHDTTAMVNMGIHITNALVKPMARKICTTLTRSCKPYLTCTYIMVILYTMVMFDINITQNNVNDSHYTPKSVRTRVYRMTASLNTYMETLIDRLYRSTLTWSSTKHKSNKGTHRRNTGINICQQQKYWPSPQCSLPIQ